MLTLRRTASLVLVLTMPGFDLDAGMVRDLQSHRTPAADRVMTFATRAGSPVVVLGGVLLIALTAPPAGVITARAAIVSLLGTNLIVEVLKSAVNRPRPDGSRSRVNSSFPSSHAANAYAIATVLADRWARAAPAFWIAAAWVSFSRVYLNRHYPSDVIAGMLIGWGVSRWVLSRRRWLAHGWPWVGGRVSKPEGSG